MTARLCHRWKMVQNMSRHETVIEFKRGSRAHAVVEFHHLRFRARRRLETARDMRCDRRPHHLLKTSDDSGVRGVVCDNCIMGASVESAAMNETCLPVLDSTETDGSPQELSHDTDHC